MSKNRVLAILAATAMSLTSSVVIAAAERGWFGFGLSVETEGVFWNPTLVSLVISEVVPGSPAFVAGLVKGDQIVEVEGKPVPGSKGKELQALLESKSPGDKLLVVLRHANGTQKSVALVAAQKPSK